MMFGLGVWEIALISIVILVFVRPEELPRVMRKIGNLYGKATSSSRRVMQGLQTAVKFDEDSSHANLNIGVATDSELKRGTSRKSSNATIDEIEEQGKGVRK